MKTDSNVPPLANSCRSTQIPHRLPPACRRQVATSPSLPRLAAFVVFPVILALYGLAGCSTSPSTYQPAPGDTGPQGFYADETLTEGDVISISCESVTNLNTMVKIPLNGMLDLAFVGQVQAAGRTTQALQEELLARYKQHVLAEELTVKLVETAARVYVSGAVLQPGKIPMDRPLTVLDAVMEAGGFDPNRARLSKVTVLRVEGDRQVSYKVNLDRALKGEDPQPFYLKPFDTVYVPAKVVNW